MEAHREGLGNRRRNRCALSQAAVVTAAAVSKATKEEVTFASARRTLHRHEWAGGVVHGDEGRGHGDGLQSALNGVLPLLAWTDGML